ncbi:MAG: beta-glucosidase [Clostridia bacterium]|nr:beta-glucosidase [Clostridia bacterium]NLS85105.1 beta-glucosidase [Oscillospiraceae bacterium]
MLFPKNFLWGAASSAYQIEGSPLADGGGASIWDTFSHKKGATYQGATGDIAADAYHRFADDIKLMAQMGLQVYRFSISWARVDPRGTGEFNGAGFDYYSRVIDACLENNIQPFVTLYHWELPQSLEDNGGWLNRDTAAAFARYAAECVARFGDRVKNFIVLNEPQCSAKLGYGNGVHAPGLTLDARHVFTVFHNLNLAYGMAVTAMRSVKSNISIGIATTGKLCYPATESDADIEAARRETFTLDDGWAFSHNMALDPIVLGRYPTCENHEIEPFISAVTADDLAIINQRPDFIGLNIYNGLEICAGDGGEPEYVKRCDGFAMTATKWPVTPRVMDYPVRFIAERYNLPVYITENGQSCNDRIFQDGAVHDPDRIDFLATYLENLSKAIAAGTDVRGYMHWCLTDNYEWNEGYKERFGLIYIDYPTQRRILKDSAKWYAEFISKA